MEDNKLSPLEERLRLAKEGLKLAQSYSRAKGVSSHLKAQGVENIRFYNRQILEILKELYRA